MPKNPKITIGHICAVEEMTTAIVFDVKEQNFKAMKFHEAVNACKEAVVNGVPSMSIVETIVHPQDPARAIEALKQLPQYQHIK